MRKCILLLICCFNLSIQAQSIKLIDSGDLPLVSTINGRLIYFNQGRLNFSNGGLSQTASKTMHQFEHHWMTDRFILKDGQKNQLIWYGSQEGLVKTDGTRKGTYLLKSIGGNFMFSWDNKLYYSISSNIYETDGTKEGTRLIISDLDWNNHIGSVVYNKNDSFIIYLSEQDGIRRLKSTNLYNLKSEILIDSLSPYAISFTTIYPSAGKSLNPVIVLKENDEKNLYLTDGRKINTRFISRVRESENNFPINKIARLHDTFYYVSGYTTSYLWKFHNKSNSLINLYTFGGGGDLEARMGAPIDIGIISNQSIVTTGYSFTNSYELWHSDGTPQNTRMLKDINPGKESSLPRILFTANKKAYFRATTRYAGRELWVTDGTESGTQMLMDCVQGSKSGFPTSVQGSGPIKTFSVYGPDSFFSDYRTVFGLDTRNDSIYSYSDLARKPQGLINYIYRNDSQVVLYYLNDSRPEMVVTNLDKTKVRYLTFPCNLSPKNTPKSILKISETEWAILEETDENQIETKKLWWYSENVPCEKEGRLIINPNPSSDELRVLFEYPLPPDATLRVYKFSGQLIREEPLTKGSPMGWRIYDIDDIKSGAYIIQVNSGSMNKTAKWIKM